jgi:hypothetical protein
VFEDDPDTAQDEYEIFWTASEVGLLPVGEQACFYSVSARLTSSESATGVEHWGIYFEDDPGFSFR